MRSWVLLAMCAAPIVARADNASQPWAAGVTEAKKAAAQKLLDAGNALFIEKKYSEALESYRLAVAQWDHPAIRFNMVRCLIQLDRPVDASDNLALALKYGAAPLDEAVYTEALSYQKLLAGQIGDLEVTCEQPGVKVTLDGAPLIACPGSEHRRVAPGPHQLVGVKDGFLTRTTDVVVIGAKQADAKVELIPLSQTAKIVHRWPEWLPWTVAGAGVLVAGIGGLVELDASSTMTSFDRQVSTACAITGCPTIDESLKNRAQAENAAAISLIAVGAAGVAAGAVMVYLNRGRTVYEQPVVGVVPASGGGLVTWSGSF
jgi:hypothetical protein